MNGTDVKEQAYQDYKSGMKYKDIAAKYGMKLSTVKSWAARYWKKGCTPGEKKLQPKKKKVATKQYQKTCGQEAIEKEIDCVLENPDLTDKQRLFCLYYVRSFNATKAYLKAYGCSYDVANAEGYKLLVKPCIRQEIKNLKQRRMSRELLDEGDIFQFYLDIATADMNDYAEVKNGSVVLKNTDQSNGMLIQELSEGKAGTKVKLYDRMKALSWLADHMDMASISQKLQYERLKLDLMRVENEVSKMELPQETQEDDGFMDALRTAAQEVWENGED